jgi:hypothetical protein
MRTFTLKHFRSIISTGVVCLAVALVLSSCSKKPQDQIVGKWIVEGQTNIMEFRADGTVSAMENGKETPARYKFLDPTNVQMDITAQVGTNSVQVQFTFAVIIHGDVADMTIKPGRNNAGVAAQTVRLKRIK